MVIGANAFSDFNLASLLSTIVDREASMLLTLENSTRYVQLAVQKKELIDSDYNVSH